MAGGEIQERCGIVYSSDSATQQFPHRNKFVNPWDSQFIRVFHVMLNNE